MKIVQWVRDDPILAGALGCALVATAHAEYTLATATHVHPWVALAVPGALDLYVIRALMQRRDVFVAVLAMVAANVTSHLIVAGELTVKWQVISAVGALAPLILWRIYALKARAGAATGAVSAPAPAAPEPATAPVQKTCPECGSDWGVIHQEAWDECGQYACTPGPGAPASALPEPHLALVPDPDAARVHLTDANRALLPRARAYLEACKAEDMKASGRGLAEEGKMSQSTARLLLKYLRIEEGL